MNTKHNNRLNALTTRLLHELRQSQKYLSNYHNWDKDGQKYAITRMEGHLAVAHMDAVQIAELTSTKPTT